MFSHTVDYAPATRVRMMRISACGVDGRWGDKKDVRRCRLETYIGMIQRRVRAAQAMPKFAKVKTESITAL